MTTLINSFLFDGFLPGNYTYGFIHIFSIVFLVFSIIYFSYILRNKDSKYIHNQMKKLAMFTLFIYFLRRGIRIYNGENFIKALWPFYLCNVNTIFLSLLIIFDIKKGKDFFITTGLAGAVLMFVVPDGVFNDKYLTLSILDSLLSHYEIIFIPMVLMITKAYTLDIKNSWQVVIGLLVIVFNVEVLQQILINEHIDYLFLQGSLPFVINGVHQFFIVFPIFIIFIYAVYLINYIYNNNKLHLKLLRRAVS